MGLEEAEAVLDPLAHLVDAHIAALVSDLGGEDEYFVGLVVVAEALGEGVHQPLGDAAYAEAFHDNAVVEAENVGDQIGAEAGRQLEQEDAGAERAAKLHRAGGPGRRHIPHQTVALYQCQRREIHRGKGVVADGLVLLGAGACDDMAAKHHHDAPAAGVEGADDAVAKVFLGVGDLVGDGLLCAGEDDGFVGVLDEIRQSRRRVGQRVGAVADDEAVVEGIILLHGLRHHQPVLRAEVGAVDAAQGQRVGAAELVQLRQMSQKLFAGEHGLETLLGADAGDGAAGGDKKQTLLCGHKKASIRKIESHS